VIRVEDLTFSYGQGQALQGVSLQIRGGETVAIVGSNGAGKTTLLRNIAGMLRPTSGRIWLDGDDVTDTGSHVRVRKGITLVPEGRQLFGGLSVGENMLLGSYHRRRSLSRQALQREVEEVTALFPILRERKSQDARSLSGGEQQMLAIARGLLAAPRILLLDEPSLGLAPKIKIQIFEALKSIQSKGELSVVVVEQDVRLALTIAERGYVLQTGKIISEDTAENLLKNPALIEGYIGLPLSSPEKSSTASS